MSANIPNSPVAIQRFFTSRDNNANASTYVGQEQRLWYNPITNAIYVSDGNTAGGIPVGTASGNGIPNGPTYSVQYNASSGNFGGTSNVVILGNGVSVVGNVATATFFIGDGSQLTNLPVQPGTYSNANVAAYLPTYGGNIAANFVSATGNVTAGYGIFSSGTTVINAGVSTTGNVTGGNMVTNNYTYANGQSIFANVAFTGNVDLGNLYIVDQAIYSKNINANIVLSPEGSGWVNVPKLAIPVGSLLEQSLPVVPIVGSLVLNQVISYSAGNSLPAGSYGNPNQVSPPWAVYEFTTTPSPALQATTDTLGGLGVPAGAVIQWVGTGAGNANIVVAAQTYTGLVTPVPAYGNVITVARQVTRASLNINTVGNTDVRLSPGASGQVVVGADIVPSNNDTYALGTPGSRFNQLWMGVGNINILDQYLDVNQTIYAYNGNLIIGAGTGIKFGDFEMFDNTIQTTNPAGNIILGKITSSGYVEVRRPFTVNSTGAGIAFQVERSGKTQVNAPGLASGNAALAIVATTSGNSYPSAAPLGGSLIHAIAAEGSPGFVTIDSYANSASAGGYLVARRFRGTVAAPLPVQAGDTMALYGAAGWNGSNIRTGVSSARITFKAAENFTANSQSANTEFRNQVIGTGADAVSAIINAAGLTLPSVPLGGTGNVGITFQDGTFQNTAYITSNSVSSITVTDGLQQNGTAPQSGAVTIDNTGLLRAVGTAQQIKVNGSYTATQTGNIVLALPQDIAPNSTVTFGNVTITGNLNVTGNTVTGNTIGINGKLFYLANNSSSNTDINFGGIALGNVDASYSRTILYDLNNNRWTTDGQANSSGSSNFYTPTIYSTNANTDYLHVLYTGHFGTTYDGADFPQATVQAYADTPSYSQVVNWNKNAGGSASADFVAVNNLGNTTNDIHYIDLGINSSTYGNTDYAVSGPNDGYLYINGGNLVIGTQSTGNIIKFHTGGTDSISYIRATISDTGISAAGNVTANNFIGNSLAATSITGTTVSASGTVTGQTVSAVGTVSGASVVGTTVSATANVVGGNIRTTGQVSAQGNITAGNLITATTIIDGGVSSSGNVTGANVFTSGLISATGNITGGNVIGIVAVSAVSVVASGNVTGGNINATTAVSAGGTITGGNINTGGNISAQGNVDAGNLRTGGLVVGTTVSATGAVRAASTVGGVITGSSVSVTGAVTAASTVGGIITGSSASVTGTVTAASTVGGVITGTSTSVTGNTTAGNIYDANGLLRSLPINSQGTAYTLTANDNGNLVSISSGNVTVPASVFLTPFGQAVTVYNNSGTTRYITQGAGVTLRLAGTAATGNRTLAQYGLATIVCVSANTFVVSGVGLS